MPELSEIAAIWAESTTADLSGLTGKPFSISAPGITNASIGQLLGSRGSFVHTRCSVRDDSQAELHFVTPIRGACVLAAVQLGRSPEDAEAMQQGAFEGEPLTAYAEVMDLCAGILGRVLDEEAELPSVQRGDSTLFEVPLGAKAPLTDGVYRRARFDVQVEGFPKSTLDILLPDALATRWFGAAQAAAEGEEDAGTLAVFDPCAAARDEADTLAEELGRRVWTIDPSEYGEDTLEDLTECSALILCWNLGGCSGLDLLERLRRDERTRELQVAIADEAPTRPMVIAALRGGADTVIQKPYQADEIRARLLTPR